MLGEEQRILDTISVLKDEHNALDHMLEDKGVDQLRQQRMKKRKLWIKDEIARLYGMLYPDGAA